MGTDTVGFRAASQPGKVRGKTLGLELGLDEKILSLVLLPIILFVGR